VHTRLNLDCNRPLQVPVHQQSIFIFRPARGRHGVIVNNPHRRRRRFIRSHFRNLQQSPHRWPRIAPNDLQHNNPLLSGLATGPPHYREKVRSLCSASPHFYFLTMQSGYNSCKSPSNVCNIGRGTAEKRGLATVTCLLKDCLLRMTKDGTRGQARIRRRLAYRVQSCTCPTRE